MKTIVIWDQCGEDSVKFFVLEGDYSKFDGVYLNSCEDHLAEELDSLVYDNGGYKVNLLNKFPTELVTQDSIVIVSGFIP